MVFYAIAAGDTVPSSSSFEDFPSREKESYEETEVTLIIDAQDGMQNVRFYV